MTRIISCQNARIKEIRALRTRKERERTGLFFVDGARAVAEALELGAPVETLVVVPGDERRPVVRKIVEQAYRRSLPCLYVSEEVFDSVAGKETSQGVGAVIRQRWQWLDRARPGDGRCWVVLGEVAYPGNLGTVLRTSDAVGGAGVLLVGNTTDPYDPASVRASTGAIFSQTLVRASLRDLAAWKARHGVAFVGTSPAATADYREIAYSSPLVLFMGGERYGLSPEMQALCDVNVRIPMIGRSDSLNLAVSTALMLYEIFRQQEAPLPGGGGQGVHHGATRP